MSAGPSRRRPTSASCRTDTRGAASPGASRSLSGGRGLSARSASPSYGKLVHHCGRSACRGRGIRPAPRERAMHVARRRILGPIPAIAWWMAAAAALAAARPAGGQSTDDAPLFTPDELEELVAPIALYPDDLVAIVLPAATYPLDVVEAARFLDELESGASVTPDEDWDDSIVALLNYPEVLRRMDQDLDWTWDLGEAFLSQQADVLDAIQRFRTQARAAGNLESDERVRVAEDQGAIRITPADPEVIYVPYYEPREV